MTKHVPNWCRGPLGGYGPGYQAWMVSQGYAPTSVRNRLGQFGQLSAWLEAGALTPSDLSEAIIGSRFAAAQRAAGRVCWVSEASVALPLEYLRRVGAAPPEPAVVVDDIHEEQLQAYRRYLITERGLAACTTATYLRIARCFCRDVAPGSDGLTQFGAADVTAFVVTVCARSSTPLAKKTVTALASLLRYLHVAGVTADPLVLAVPRVAGRGPGLPLKGPGPGEVARLLSSCDRRTSVGLRNHAVLVLLARLGLRAGEVASLRLEDIDWHHGEVTIRGKGDRQERLPLPSDVGAAVASYLHRGRVGAPPGCRAVFLRALAPPGALTAGAVSLLVRSASQRAGLTAFGPHRLRHGAATQMLRQGAPLTGVAQVLRHHALAVTASYATVDPDALRELARPWPAGVA